MLNKNKRSLVASVLALSLSFYLVSPVIAADTSNITTQVQINSAKSPIIKAKWEMNTDDTVQIDDDDTGTDDASDKGAQFDPSGQFNVGKKIAVCAIVADPDGLADIDTVNAQVFYPANVSLGPVHPNQGCGSSQSTVSLAKIGDELAETLFCTNITAEQQQLADLLQRRIRLRRNLRHR